MNKVYTCFKYFLYLCIVIKKQVKINDMNSVFYKVNGKGQYKNYMNGTYAEASKAFGELIHRATSKGFQMVSRAFGTGGLNLTYSNGVTRVEIVLVETDRDREWLAFFDKCQAEREARERMAA